MPRSETYLAAGSIILILLYVAYSGMRHPKLASLNSAKLKTFHSRGGEVEFRLPETWVTEPEETCQRYFYPDPDSGTLRLTVLGLEMPKESYRLGEALRVVQKKMEGATPIQPHPSGGAFFKAEHESVENGERIFMTLWEWEYPASDHIVVSNFSYTLLVSQRNDSVHKATLEMLDREIRAAKVLR